VKSIIFVLIFIAIACVLSTRRIGWRNWQSWVLYALVALAADVGRWA
jgi:hypothetical protein